MENGKRVNVILVILLLVLLFVAYGFGYMWYKNKNIGCPKCEETNVSKDNENLKVHFDDFCSQIDLKEYLWYIFVEFKEKGVEEMKILNLNLYVFNDKSFDKGSGNLQCFPQSL